MVVESPHSAATRAAHIIRCQYPDVEIPDLPITEFVLGHAAERGDKPAIVGSPFTPRRAWAGSRRPSIRCTRHASLRSS